MNNHLDVAEQFVEVSGYFVSSVMEVLLSDDMAPTLNEFGFQCLHLETWYPQSFVLDVLDFVLDVVEDEQGDFASSKLMAELGRRMIATSILPPLRTVEDCLLAVVKIYSITHRKSRDNECLYVEQVGDRRFQVTNATPYPDELIFGQLHAIMQRIVVEEPYTIVEYGDPLTMIDGTEYTVFDISY
jgi:hypothetical protein